MSRNGWNELGDLRMMESKFPKAWDEERGNWQAIDGVAELKQTLVIQVLRT